MKENIADKELKNVSGGTDYSDEKKCPKCGTANPSSKCIVDKCGIHYEFTCSNPDCNHVWNNK